MVVAQKWYAQNYLVEQPAQSRSSKSLLFPFLHLWKLSIFFCFQEVYNSVTAAYVIAMQITSCFPMEIIFLSVKSKDEDKLGIWKFVSLIHQNNLGSPFSCYLSLFILLASKSHLPSFKLNFKKWTHKCYNVLVRLPPQALSSEM